MWVARLRWVALPGSKVDSTSAVRDGAGFLEGVKVDGIDLQASGRCHLQTAPALVALLQVQVHFLRVDLVFDDRLMRAAGGDALAGFSIRAVLGEPVAVKMHRVVHRAACLTDHAAQRQVLEGAPKPQLGCPLTCEKLIRKVAS